MIIEIKAKFACDECGSRFTVLLDPGYDPPADWTVCDVAEDAVRGGLWYEDETNDRTGSWSIGDDNRHYCARCTKAFDSVAE